ncbi:DUF3467 domain-containing protein [Candidatus Uhrbacteria bacterium]|nr:DUF3467 domain-containing protein [Candidatus Uhrbacteria bacterium]
MSQPQPMNVNAMPEDMKGNYANIVAVTSQERDVVIDFLAHTRVGDQQQAQLVSRIFLNHFTAKELAEVIQKTLAEYEKLRYEVPKK